MAIQDVPESSKSVANLRHGHPTMGIISFAIPALTVACCLGLYVLAYGMFIFSAESMTRLTARGFKTIPPEAYGLVGSSSLFGLCMVAAPCLALIGLILAVISYRRQDTERTFPTLGVIANGTLLIYGCLVVGMIGLFALLVVMSASR